MSTGLLPEPWLPQLRGSPDLARVYLTADPPNDPQLREAELWQTLARAANLESLTLSDFEEIGGEQLRQLRGSKSLQHICLSASTAIVDDEVAAALAEIPQLRSLEIVGNRVTPAAIAVQASRRLAIRPRR